MSGVEHHDQPMYRDYRDGSDMLRWLCAEPGCSAVLTQDTFDTMQEMSWADQHGIQLPGVTMIGGDPS